MFLSFQSRTRVFRSYVDWYFPPYGIQKRFFGRSSWQQESHLDSFVYRRWAVEISFNMSN